MNLDVLAAMFTLLLIATMIGLASKGEPVAGAMYIVYGGGIYLFWQVMRGLACATTSKNFIRGSYRAEAYREDTPARYWLLLICSVVLNAYIAGMIFDFPMFY